MPKPALRLQMFTMAWDIPLAQKEGDCTHSQPALINLLCKVAYKVHNSDIMLKQTACEQTMPNSVATESKALW